MSYSGIPQVNTTIRILVGEKYMYLNKTDYVKYIDFVHKLSTEIYGSTINN